MSKAAFVFIWIFKVLSKRFGHVGTRLDKKAKVNMKIYDVTDRQTKIIAVCYTYCPIPLEVKAIRQ